MGFCALVAAATAQWLAPGRWLEIWLAVAMLAFAIGGVAMARKARAQGVRLSRGVGRRFLLSLTPPLWPNRARLHSPIRPRHPHRLNQTRMHLRSQLHPPTRTRTWVWMTRMNLGLRFPMHEI